MSGRPKAENPHDYVMACSDWKRRLQRMHYGTMALLKPRDPWNSLVCPRGTMYSCSSVNTAKRVQTNLVRLYWLKIGMCHRLVDYIRRVAIRERYQFQKIFLIK